MEDRLAVLFVSLCALLRRRTACAHVRMCVSATQVGDRDLWFWLGSMRYIHHEMAVNVKKDLIMVFGLSPCYVASWRWRSLPLRGCGRRESNEESELVAFDRLNTMRSTVPYVYGQDAWDGLSARLWLGELEEEEDGL